MRTIVKFYETPYERLCRETKEDPIFPCPSCQTLIHRDECCAEDKLEFEGSSNLVGSGRYVCSNCWHFNYAALKIKAGIAWK